MLYKINSFNPHNPTKKYYYSHIKGRKLKLRKVKEFLTIEISQTTFKVLFKSGVNMGFGDSGPNAPYHVHGVWSVRSRWQWPHYSGSIGILSLYSGIIQDSFIQDSFRESSLSTWPAPKNRAIFLSSLHVLTPSIYLFLFPLLFFPFLLFSYLC